MGGVPSLRLPGEPLAPGPRIKPQLKQVPTGPEPMVNPPQTPPQSGLQQGILPLGDMEAQQLLPQGPPLLIPELTLFPTVTQLPKPWPWGEWDGQHSPGSPYPIQKSWPQTSPSGLQGYDLQPSSWLQTQSPTPAALLHLEVTDPDNAFHRTQHP